MAFSIILKNAIAFNKSVNSPFCIVYACMRNCVYTPESE